MVETTHNLATVIAELTLGDFYRHAVIVARCATA